MELLVRATGIIVFLLVGLIGYFSKVAKLPKRYEGLQLAKSVKEVGEIIVDREGTALDEIKKSLDVDNSHLIPVYWLLFVCIAVLLARREISWATWLAVAAGRNPLPQKFPARTGKNVCRPAHERQDPL